MRTYQPSELLLMKSKYTRRWKGKDGKWNYEYGTTPKGSKAPKGDDIVFVGNEPSEDAPVDRVKTAEAMIPGVNISKVLKRRVEFTYKGENYAMGGGGVVGLATKQPDGKTWYSYGGTFNSVIRSADKNDFRDVLAISSQYNYKKGYTDYYYK